MDRQQHWDAVYRAKGATGVSWYQPKAAISLELIRRLAPDRATPILDVGGGAARVRWLAADVLDAPLPAAHWGLWHDRAVFHFLVRPDDRERYVAQVRRAVRPGGHVLVAAFGLDGPAKCSGLEVVRYGPDSMHGEFGDDFRLLESVSEEHRTPTGAVQSFVYCLCRFDERAAR